MRFNPGYFFYLADLEIKFIRYDHVIRGGG